MKKSIEQRNIEIFPTITERVNKLYDAYLLDLDGTVLLGNNLIPGAEKVIKMLRDLDKRVIFISNNSTSSASSYADQLTSLGVPTQNYDVINSSQVLINFLNKDTRFQIENFKPGLIGSYIVGISFAFGWTPCIGPILGSVLSVAASSDSIYFGIWLLLTYSAGLGIPFLLAAAGIGYFLKFLVKIRSYIRPIEIFTGLLLILFGVQTGAFFQSLIFLRLYFVARCESFCT